ncbi:MAG: GIY-YIG nuclease family protein [Candidatus Faecousia sp.]|nr:GIY-YIG nuclease family protein [Candidatus Faecousia sp.]
METSWELYILRCGDGTLYTGIARDAEKRLEVHRSGKGTKYTRGRGPLQIVYRERCPDHGTALRREYAIKQLSRDEKERLILQSASSKE